MTDSEKLDLLIVQMQAMNGPIGNPGKTDGQPGKAAWMAWKSSWDSMEIRMDGHGNTDPSTTQSEKSDHEIGIAYFGRGRTGSRDS